MGGTAHLPVTPLFMAETAMQNILLIYEDDSFEVLSISEHIERLAEANIFHKPIRQKIYRDFIPEISGEKCYISRTRSTNSRWMGLSSFPEEIRSLLILYEI